MGYGTKNRARYQAPRQSTLHGHIPKGVWVVRKDYRWQGALCSRPEIVNFYEGTNCKKDF